MSLQRESEGRPPGLSAPEENDGKRHGPLTPGYGRRGRVLALALAGALGLLAVAACSSASTAGGGPAGGSSPEAKLTQLTVAYPTAGTSGLSWWIGTDKGIWAKNGLAVNSTVINASPGLASLTHSQVQFTAYGIAPAFAAIAQGLQIQIIGTTAANPPKWDLVGGPGITSVDQLKGKVVADGTAATQSDVVTRMALQKLGLTPGKDVHLELVGQAGNSNQRLAALLAGKVAAAMIDDGDLGQLKSINPHILLSYKALASIPYAGSGLEASTDYLKAHSSVAVSFLRGYQQVDAWAADPANEPEVLSIAAKHLNASEVSLKDSVDSWISTLPKTLTNDEAALQGTLTALNSAQSTPISVDLASTYTNTYLDQAGSGNAG